MTGVAGFLYLAVVLDAFSRRILGWSMATMASIGLDAVVAPAAGKKMLAAEPKDVAWTDWWCLWRRVASVGAIEAMPQD